MALVHNKPEFVELMLETGINLKAFLSKRRLYYLYNSQIVRDAERKCPLLQLFKKKYYTDSFITFRGLVKFLKDYLFEDFKPAFLPADADDLSRGLNNFMVTIPNRKLLFNFRPYTFGRPSFHKEFFNIKTNIKFFQMIENI